MLPTPQAQAYIAKRVGDDPIFPHGRIRKARLKFVTRRHALLAKESRVSLNYSDADDKWNEVKLADPAEHHPLKRTYTLLRYQAHP